MPVSGISLNAIENTLQAGLNFVQALQGLTEPFGEQLNQLQSSRKHKSSSKQRWTPGEKATSGTRRSRHQSRSKAQSSQQTLFAAIVPTSSVQEYDQIVALLEQRGLGGTPTKQKIMRPNS